MKKSTWVSLIIVLTVILSLGGFTNPARANEHVPWHPGHHYGLLMDPIKIEQGYISGTFFGDPDNPVHIYRGIPYAAPPVGDLRWKPPQPPAKWSGIRECVDFSMYPVQFRPGRFYPVNSPQSENCLYLNVLTPARHTHEKLPVMVWFHGGGLDGSSGNDDTWNFYRLPQHGVVVVTVNTRLGTLAILAHPDLTAESPNHVSGNYIFLDMVAALKWVQKNIAAFGGDPGNVTIFGQSGGGLKVIGLMASPFGKGLFHRAIVESGPWSCAPLAQQEAWGQQYFANLGVTTLAQARAVTWENLVQAYTTMPRAPGAGVALDGWFLPDDALNIFADGHQNAVPLMVTAVLGELNVLFFVIPQYVEWLTGNLNLGIKGYAGIFDHVPANWRAAGITSYHADDLPYIFGVYDDPQAYIWKFLTSIYAPSLPPQLGEEDKLISEAIMTALAEFAKTGDPNVKGKAKGLVYWPAWTPSGDKYIYWDDPIQIKSGFSHVGP